MRHYTQLFVLYFKQSCPVAHTGLELTDLLPWPPECCQSHTATTTLHAEFLRVSLLEKSVHVRVRVLFSYHYGQPGHGCWCLSKTDPILLPDHAWLLPFVHCLPGLFYFYVVLVFFLLLQ